MDLRSGIPLVSDVDALQRNGEFRRHVEFNGRFIGEHREALKEYGFHWGDDPLKLWSRRWEYPFAGQKVTEFARQQPNPAVRVLDAGSGVTYFPYLLCEELPGASVVCCDSNASYERMFGAINQRVPGSRVSFRTAMLQALPLQDAEMDAICCISVLEHTDNYREILGEFRRVLRPGGLLVLTFDLSLDGKFKLTRPQAEALLGAIGESFAVEGDLQTQIELEKMKRAEEILSTDHVRKTEPELLPWRYPKLMAVKDLLSGKGWTGGFRSKSVFCLAGKRA